MKKALLTVVALMGVTAAYAQLFQVGASREVSLPSGVAAEQAVISPDGSKVAFVDMHGTGLQVVDVKTGIATHVSDKAISLDLAFTADGSAVVFDEVSYKNQLRRVAVKSYDLTKGTLTTIIKDTRDLQGVAVDGGNVKAIAGGKTHARRVAPAPSAERPVLSIDRGQLCITADGKTTQLSPLGVDGMSYLWPSLSPDGKRICFYAAGMGCYTCALDGSDVRKLGWLRAAQWYDNDVVVGMRDRTDGRFTTESAILAKSIDGTDTQTITPENVVAVLPSVASGKIAYSTVDGRVFLLDVTRK